MKIVRLLVAGAVAALTTLSHAAPEFYGVTTGLTFDAAKKALAFCDGCRAEDNERPKEVSHYTVYLNYTKEFYANTPNHGVNFYRPWEAVFVTTTKQGQVVSVLNQIHTDEATADRFIARRAKESGIALASISESLEGMPATTLISGGRSRTQFLGSEDASGTQYRISKVRARSGLYLVSASYTDFDLYHSGVMRAMPEEVTEHNASYVLAMTAKSAPVHLAYGTQAESSVGVIKIGADGGAAVMLNDKIVHKDDYPISGIAKLPGLEDRFIVNVWTGGNSCAGNMSKMLRVVNGKVAVSEEFGFCGPPTVYDAEQLDSSFVMLFESDNPEYEDQQVYIMR